MHPLARDFLEPRVDGCCRVKICGLTRLEEIHFCADKGADAVGLNFWPQSKRYVDPGMVNRWRDELPDSLLRVGVFVNETIDAVLRLLDAGVIHAAQLHGDECPEDCALLRDRGHCVFKAMGMKDENSLDQLSLYNVDAAVLDAFCPGQYGGSGKTFNWELALEAKRVLGGTPLVLSGGLTVENIAAAIDRVAPRAVDVASGVESAPGIKSNEKMLAFLQAARSPRA